MPGMSRELRLLMTARTTALRLYTRQANRFMQDLRGSHEPEVLNDAERLVNRLYADAADAHDRWVAAAGVEKEAPINIAWMDGLRSKHNQCMAAIDRARSGNNSGQTTDWLVDDQRAQIANPSAPTQTNQNTNNIEHAHDGDNSTDANNVNSGDGSLESVLNSTPINDNIPRLDANMSAGASRSSIPQPRNDDAKRRRLEMEFQIAQRQREQDRELEDLKRKQQHERQDMLHRLELEQLLSETTTGGSQPPASNQVPTVPAAAAQVPIVSSAFARIQLDKQAATAGAALHNPFAHDLLNTGNIVNRAHQKTTNCSLLNLRNSTNKSHTNLRNWHAQPVRIRSADSRISWSSHQIANCNILRRLSPLESIRSIVQCRHFRVARGRQLSGRLAASSSQRRRAQAHGSPV